MVTINPCTTGNTFFFNNVFPVSHLVSGLASLLGMTNGITVCRSAALSDKTSLPACANVQSLGMTRV